MIRHMFIRSFIMTMIFFGTFMMMMPPTHLKSADLISAKQLVVMVKGRFPTSGTLTSGAGIVVGRRGGLVYIATAGHVVQDLMETAEDIKIQFLDQPGIDVNATIYPTQFDKGVDVAMLVAAQSETPKTITDHSTYPTARLTNEIQLGENIYLLGQPAGKAWSGNNAPEKVLVARSTEIEVESNTVVPGLSGGAGLDEKFRIIGIIVETDNGVARLIPARRLKEIFESSGYPFMLEDMQDAPSIRIVPIGVPFKLQEGEVLDLPDDEMLSFRFINGNNTREDVYIYAGDDSKSLTRGRSFTSPNGCRIDYVDFEKKDPSAKDSIIEAIILRVPRCKAP